MAGTDENLEHWIECVGSPGALISYLYRTNQTFLARELKAYNLGAGQFPFLMTLYHEGEANQDALARARGYDKTTTTRALKKLEDAGYISREKDQADGRAKVVRLSEEGKKIYPEMDLLSREWAEVLFSNFSEEERETARNVLTKMALNVSSYMRQEGKRDPDAEQR